MLPVLTSVCVYTTCSPGFGALERFGGSKANPTRIGTAVVSVARLTSDGLSHDVTVTTVISVRFKTLGRWGTWRVTLTAAVLSGASVRVVGEVMSIPSTDTAAHRCELLQVMR